MTQNAKKKRGDVLPHKRRAIRARAAREGTDDLWRDTAPAWQATFDAVTDAIWLLDGEQRIVHCNRAALHFFGKSCRDTGGCHCWEIVHGTQQPIPECPFLRMRHSLHRESMELAMNERWYQVTVDPLLAPNGKLRGAVHIVSDITAHKQTEAALQQVNTTLEQRVAERTAMVQESERLLRQVIDLVPHHIFAKDRDGRFLFVNRAAAESCGRPAEQIVGRLERELRADRAEVERFQRDDREVLERDTPKLITEETIHYPDNQLHFLQTTKIPFTPPGTQQRAVLGVAVDITARKQAEEALRESADRLRATLAAAHAVAWELDLASGTLLESGPIAEFFGLPDGSRLGSNATFFEHIHPDDRPHVRAQVERALQGAIKDYSVEFRLLLPAGGIRWVTTSGSIVRDDNGCPLHLRGISFDITARKQAERALRASEEKFQRLATHLDEVLYSVDAGTCEFRYLSPSFEKIFGYSLADIQRMGGRRAFLARVIQGDRFAEQDRNLDRLRHAPTKVAYDTEGWWQGKDGTLRLMEDHWVPVYEQGRLVSTEGILRDVTKRNQLEQQILTISEQEQIRIAHDLHDSLGQQLAAVKFMSGTLGKKLAKQKSPDARTATRIERELQQALVEVRAIARGLHPVRPTGEGLRSALSELAANITTRFKLPCHCACPGQVVIHDVHAATHLFRIAQEAAGNAARHANAKHLWLQLRRSKGGIRLRIEDDGCGLPSKPQPQTGLGLRIMQYRASVIGATFAVAARPGGGTRITCDWKANAPQANAQHSAPENKAGPG